MSEPHERQQDGNTPGSETRRLRNVAAYIDPFLVTRLPQQAVVQGGVIRLFEKTVLGFVREPFPDGTRVLVRYEDWLVAERVAGEASHVEASTEPAGAAGLPPPEPPLDIPPPAERPPLDWPPVEEPPVDVPPRDVPPGKDPPPGRPPADVPPVDDPPVDNPPNNSNGPRWREPSAADERPAVDEPSKVDEAPAAQVVEGPAPRVIESERQSTADRKPTANGAVSRQSQPAGPGSRVGEPPAKQPDLFPDDLTDSDRSRSGGSGTADPWSDAFRPSRGGGRED